MTSVLTHIEAKALRDANPVDLLALILSVENAVIRKLAAGVSVEPSHYNVGGVSMEAFDRDQLTTAIAAARVQENERCARTLEAIGCQGYADALRALLGKEQS